MNGVQKSISFALCPVNYFKSLNNTYIISNIDDLYARNHNSTSYYNKDNLGTRVIVRYTYNFDTLFKLVTQVERNYCTLYFLSMPFIHVIFLYMHVSSVFIITL